MDKLFEETEVLQIAYHEIGHIIVKEHFGGIIKRIKIDEKSIKVQFEHSNMTIYQDICIGIAGFLTEETYFGKLMGFDNQSDTKFVLGLLDTIGIYKEQIIKRAIKETKEIVENNETRIKILSEQLSHYIIEWNKSRVDNSTNELILNYSKRFNKITY